MLEKKLNELAPKENGLRDDLYGIQFGSILEDNYLHRIVICLEPTKKAIIEAKKLNSHLIISHHGITHKPLLYMNDSIIDQITLFSLSKISLFVMHTAWDAAQGGISETFAKIAGFKIIDILYCDDHGKSKPIGRIGVPLSRECKVIDIVKNLKRNLKLKYVQICGDPNNLVKKAAIVGGKGFRAEDIFKAIKKGCDTFITGEFSYPDFLLARTLGINLIASSHYTSEKIGMENLQMILSLEFPRDEFYFIETEDPVKIV